MVRDHFVINTACPVHKRQCKCSLRNSRRIDRRRPGHIVSTRDPEVPLDPIVQSDTGLRVSSLVQCIERLGLHASPIVFLPSRLGRSKVLDAAADTLILLATGPVPETAVQSIAVRRKYAATLQLVQSGLKSDFTFAERQDVVGAVSILGTVDVLDRGRTRSRTEACKHFFTHWKGMSGLLMDYPDDMAQCEIARASVTLAGCLIFAIPCLTGKPSPFENSHLLRCATVSLRSTWPDVQRLNDMANLLLARLPRLVCNLRQVYAGTTPMADVQDLAQELLAYEDSASEATLLARATVRKLTASPSADENPLVPPVMLQFGSVEDMTAAVLYWQARMFITMIFSVTVSSHGIDARRQTLATNIIGAWEGARDWPFASSAPFTLGLASCWLGLRQDPSFNGVPIASVAAWIIKALEHTYGGWAIGGTVEDLQAACNLFVGGPIQGHLAHVVQSPPDPQ